MFLAAFGLGFNQRFRLGNQVKLGNSLRVASRELKAKQNRIQI